MNNYFVILSMMFLHIIDDFVLQTFWFSYWKQKKTWDDLTKDRKYRFDYICALYLHSFSWAFMVMLPIAHTMRFQVSGLFVFILILNMLIHAWVDDMKANKRKLNLWQDQLIHIWQISMISAIFL